VVLTVLTLVVSIMAVGAGGRLRDSDRGADSGRMTGAAGTQHGARPNLPGPAAAALEGMAMRAAQNNAGSPPATATVRPADSDPAPQPPPRSGAPSRSASGSTTETRPPTEAAASRAPVPGSRSVASGADSGGNGAMPSAGSLSAASPAVADGALPSPSQRCGRRMLMALWRCMDRECESPELKGHAECVQWRQENHRAALPP
jgi:hypothetical protein